VNYFNLSLSFGYDNHIVFSCEIRWKQVYKKDIIMKGDFN